MTQDTMLENMIPRQEELEVAANSLEVSPEVNLIASTMGRLAKRVNAQFVIDPEKAQEFAVAVDNRRKRRARTDGQQR